ncbi:MAG: bifunctional 4-hydroxy-2-oxoglutarate aldolase/2-dehydro-3-deoxy-phosphogluconate aldolase [Oscillospiraceae bacterium]|nr:bifunctional 4-hydroxy-2-oxoglutarate aldolase/2-dehydro-3-deoxy-phosphogluconate aldolase [Oscillospiraceae bacterium]
MNEITKRISDLGIVPVIKLDDPADAVPLAKALLKGGIGCAEVTFRTDAAEQAIKNIVREVPEMLAGAGTVLTVDQAKRAIGAGAKFLVSPGFNEKVVRYAIEQGVPMIPGCSNPSDIERALELGLTDLKFFPAEQAGGLEMIKALCGPYTTVRFMPTGGINPDNFLQYLANDKIIAVGGSWMVKADLIKAKKFDEITKMCDEAVRKMLGFELLHIGINCADDREAAEGAQKFCTLLGLEAKDGASSVFAGKIVELMKKPYLGRHGHIAIGVNSVDRAYAYFTAKGYAFNESTISRDPKGKMKVAYLQDEICGFAVHFVNK